MELRDAPRLAIPPFDVLKRMKSTPKVLFLIFIFSTLSGCGTLRKISEKDIEGVYITDGLIDHFYEQLVFKEGNEFEEWDLFYGYYPEMNDYDVNIREIKSGKWELNNNQLELTTLLEDDEPVGPSTSVKRIFEVKKKLSGVFLVEEGTSVPYTLKRSDEE